MAGRKQFDGKNEKMVIAKLEECWALGASDAEAAFFAEISPTALSRYLETHPAISQRKEALKLSPVLAARRCLVEAVKTDPELALKYLERVKRDEFSLKFEVDHRDKTLEELLCEANKKEAPARARSEQ